MNRSDKTYKKRIMLLVSTVMMIVLLCGCRTRLTNNTEVESTIADESGMMTETYQLRRDELGIPVAEPPLFMGSGSDDEEEEEDWEEYDEEEEEDWEDEEEEEEDWEDEEDEEDGDQPARTSTPSYRPHSTGSWNPSTPQTSYVTAKLDLNAKDAKCSRSSVSVKKGYTYGALPVPTRTDYDFEGWYTAKKGGSKVSSTTKVTTDKTHTLYAHWKKTEKKKYTITFDGNGEEDEVTLSSTEISVEEGGNYGDLPTAKRKKYSFSGWFTEASGGTQITKKTKFTANKDQTLYAHWEHDPYKWWKDEFEKSANGIDGESESSYLIDEDSEGDADKADSFLKECRIRKTEEGSEPAVIIKFIKKYDEEKAEAEAEALHEKYSETAADAKIIIVSTDAIYGGNEEKLLYMLTMLSDVYGSGYDLYEAEYDLYEGNSVSMYVYEAE